MVAKIALDGLLLHGVNIALKYDVTILRNTNITRQRLDQSHGLLAQESCQQIFVHIVGHRCRGSIGINGIATQRNHNGHSATQTLIAVVVACSGLMYMPVHTSRALIEALHTVHTNISYARLGV